MDTVNSFLIVILLLVANGFYVAAEFALVKARGFRIESLAAEGSAAARLTIRIQSNLEAYLAACQLGITMASLGLGWVGEPAVAALLEPLFSSMGMSEATMHTSAFLVGFLLFSALHIVIGEQVPKTFAIRTAERVSILTAYPLHWFFLVLYPLNWVLNAASKGMLAMFGVKEATHGDVYSTDELRGLVEVSHEHGEIGVAGSDPAPRRRAPGRFYHFHRLSGPLRTHQRAHPAPYHTLGRIAGALYRFRRARLPGVRQHQL